MNPLAKAVAILPAPRKPMVSFADMRRIVEGQQGRSRARKLRMRKTGVAEIRFLLAGFGKLPLAFAQTLGPGTTPSPDLRPPSPPSEEREGVRGMVHGRITLGDYRAIVELDCPGRFTP